VDIKLAKKLSLIVGILIFFYLFLSAKLIPIVNANCDTAHGDYCADTTKIDFMTGCQYIYGPPDPIYHIPPFLYCTQEYNDGRGQDKSWTIGCPDHVACTYEIIGLECTSAFTCSTANHTHSGTCCVNGTAPTATPGPGGPTNTPVPPTHTPTPTTTPTVLP
jgi:hypothetical protein